jgi:putative oxidoreductase
MKRLLSTQSLNTDVATLLLRLIVGAMFVRYGYMKFEAYDTILPMFGDIIGIGAKLSFNLVIFAELFCGFLVLIGLVTRYAIVPIFITMIVAFFVAHAKDAFDIKIAAFLYLVLCLPIFILGSGKYSVDNMIFNRKRTE